jgi:hypothetical protein
MGFKQSLPFLINATMGSISLGSSFVIGNNRVPKPAAGITAFLSKAKTSIISGSRQI